MDIKLITPDDLKKLTSTRAGETKIGETLQLGSELLLEELQDSKVQFVIFGIPEDIGPRANLGRGGSDSAWEAFVQRFINLQDNQHLAGESCMLLGSIENKQWKNIASTDHAALREAVEKLDVIVSELVQMIVAANKIPILIGGGHNNAYGAIKGCFQATGKAINCINLDPHADYRALEGRHSGNSFSYAKKEGFLNQYALVGLHKNYNSKNMLQQLNADGIYYNFFEDIFIENKISYALAIQQMHDKVKQDTYGVELDCDAIENFPTSAQTPSGISANQARQYICQVAASKKAIYLHLPEAAPSLIPGSEGQVGKLLAYLVADFIRIRGAAYHSSTN